jgi:dsRNA-specific ribonuclease
MMIKKNERLAWTAPLLLDTCEFVLTQVLAYAGEEEHDDSPNGEIIRRLRAAIRAATGAGNMSDDLHAAVADWLDSAINDVAAMPIARRFVDAAADELLDLPELRAALTQPAPQEAPPERSVSAEEVIEKIRDEGYDNAARRAEQILAEQMLAAIRRERGGGA